MPLASMSKVTSIFGTPRGAGGRPVSSKLPSGWFCAHIWRSPWATLISTDGWLSSAVVKISERLVGIVVLRSISVVITPPLVSMPRRQRGDVEQQHVLDLALEDAGLERRADRDDLVGVDALVGLLAAEQLLDHLGDGRHPGGAADQHDVVDVGDRDAAVLEHRLERRLGAVEQVGGHLLELGAGQLLLEVQRAGLAVGDVGQVDRGLAGAGQLDLRLLRGLLEALLGDLVGARGRRRCPSLNLLDHPVDDAGVPVVTTEVVVAGGRLDLDHALADLEQGHVERAAAEVEDEDGLVVALVEPVGERGRGRLVDDPRDGEPRDLAGLLGRLALRVGEVRRHGDHRVGDRSHRGRPRRPA